LFPIEIHYENMNLVFTELLYIIFKHLEELDKNILMVNKLFYLEGNKIKEIRDEELYKNIKHFLLNNPFFNQDYNNISKEECLKIIQDY